MKSFTDDPQSFASYGTLQTANGQRIEITKFRPAANEFICTLNNVADRNAAEALKGVDLYAERASLPAEPLLADFIGKPVTANANALGSIAGFQNFGAGELMELDTGLLIPVRFATFGDPVTVDLPEGFLDEARRDE